MKDTLGKVEAVVSHDIPSFSGWRDSDGTTEVPYWRLEAILTGLIRSTLSGIYPAACNQGVGCDLPVSLSAGDVELE